MILPLSHSARVRGIKQMLMLMLTHRPHPVLLTVAYRDPFCAYIHAPTRWPITH